MTEITDLVTLQAAIWENRQRPHGISQAAAAEKILDRATQIGPQAEVRALFHLINAYEFSADRPKALVPFVRALRLWDEDPSVFDHASTRSLFWDFKWMTTGMLDLPQVPLDAIENWLAEMDRRYRLAGHTERAVRMSEFYVADHVGDTERAQQAFEGWLAAERGEMADCHACETARQGEFFADNGADTKAVEHWEPVLAGRQTCAEEPHRALAHSLLPLVRLGRLDEARRNHLRGYPMVKGSESLMPSVARHIEFCALTGNEARGLELLADTPAYFDADREPEPRMGYLAVTALLMDRLVVLGHGGLQVPGPAHRSWTAAELAHHARTEALALAARFDERNGTTAVGERVRARLDAEPLLDRLPLGLRAVLPTAGPPVPDPAAPHRTAADHSQDAEADATVMPAGVREAVDRYNAACETQDLAGMRSGMADAIDRAGDTAAPEWLLAAHLQLAEVLAADGDPAGAVHHGLEAVAWADLVDRPTAVVARARLGGYLMSGGRFDEAAPVLEQALADLDPSPEVHGDGTLVQVRWWLGDCATARYEHAEAAQHWLAAAQVAQHWPEQDDHAVLANLAAEALDRAGEKLSAELAYERAADLWAGLGDAMRQIRATRAWAWAVRNRDVTEASRIMTGATRACEAALADATDPDELAVLRAELPETLEQHARVIADEDEGTSRFGGLYEGALEEAAELASRAESLLRESDDVARWCRSALLAAELAVEAGGTVRGLELVAEVESRIQGVDELSGFGGHAGWIRERVTA
ncbi:tetratricopeptide repeat protein [Promicromonospora iranensis]|uniref:Tetratricopeptide (TPR) repeat protein n=1 Tax=Promicromonospora iranensis TaxID=1105144 RepID=A0ABU2CJG1_9MICO|nr:tetratricopeptide repeat protein [Promicromonospora iranensis]MDR7381473.1 tetratricopeptide (TPR) repeat protein [Promicromonospora iranensis]